MFERLHAQAAKVYARKPKPGAGTAPFYTKPSATEQAAKRQRTDEASASGAQPNHPPDAGKNKTFYSLPPLFFFPFLFQPRNRIRLRSTTDISAGPYWFYFKKRDISSFFLLGTNSSSAEPDTVYSSYYSDQTRYKFWNQLGLIKSIWFFQFFHISSFFQ